MNYANFISSAALCRAHRAGLFLVARSLARFLHFGLVFVSAFLGTRQQRIRNVGLRPQERRGDGEISTGEHDLGALAKNYFVFRFSVY
jgi:hypothetical protein